MEINNLDDLNHSGCLETGGVLDGDSESSTCEMAGKLVDNILEEASKLFENVASGKITYNDVKNKFVNVNGHITELPDGNGFIFHGKRTTVVSTANLDNMFKITTIEMPKSSEDRKTEPLFSRVFGKHLVFFFWDDPAISVLLEDFLSNPEEALIQNGTCLPLRTICRFGVEMREELFGVNQSNQLITMLTVDKIPLPLLESHQIRSMSAGTGHLLCATNAGSIFSIGRNDYGQCGFKDRAEIAHISEIKMPKILGAPIKVVCGYEHSCVLYDTGILWTFGNNSSGQLCRNDTETIGFSNVPFVRDVAAAGNYSVCVRTPEEAEVCYMEDPEEQLKLFKTTIDITVQLVGFGHNSCGQLASGEDSISGNCFGSAVCLYQIDEEQGPHITDQCELAMISAYPNFLYLKVMTGTVYISGKLPIEQIPRPYLIDCDILSDSLQYDI